MENKEHMDNYS